MKKSYIKNLEYKFFTIGNIKYLTVEYERNEEYNKITYKLKKDIKQNANAVRKFINS
jgi:hypothetical protein